MHRSPAVRFVGLTSPKVTVIIVLKLKYRTCTTVDAPMTASTQ